MFQEMAAIEGAWHLRCILGWGKLLRGIDKIFFKDRLVKKYLVKEKKKKLLGTVLCETNWEIAESYIRKDI